MKLKNNIISLCFAVFAFTAYGQEVAKDFAFTTVDGVTTKLSDYKEQVVYISFWASWCKPCISNFRKYESIRNEMEALGITLLNVNIDKEEKKWHTAMKNNTINGVHVRGVDLEGLQELYQLYSIPYYEIINKQGMLVYLSEDGSRNILDEFRSWMAE